MKKEKLKKFLVSSIIGIMALIMPFSFGGCNLLQDPVKADAEAYVMLNEFVKDFKVVNSQNSYENLIDMGKQQEIVFDFENSDLLPETINTLHSMEMQNKKTNFNRKKEYYLNRDNNTGYFINKVFNYETLTYDIRNLDVTKKVDDEYINYSVEYSYPKKAEFVDSDYAKNTYVYDLFYSDSPETSSIFDSIKENDTFKSFVDNSHQIAADIINESAELTINADDLQVLVDITEKNGDYILTAIITANNLLVDSDEYSSTYVDVDAIFTITFNENGIINSGAKMTLKQSTTMKSIMYSAMFETNNANIDESDTIKMVATLGLHFHMNFDATLNDRNTIMNNDYDNFNFED